MPISVDDPAGCDRLVAFALGCKSKEQAAPAPAAKPPADASAKAPAPAPGTAPAPIAIEAEDCKNNVKKGALAWVPVTKPEGFSGKGAMQAMPNDNVNNDTGFVEDSPRLDYEVDFPKAGTYIVWVRGWGETEEDNSCHVGLDGKEVETSDRIAEFSAEWLWIKDTKDGEDAVIKVAAPGKHVLNVWMREDGFILDRIVLTMDPKYTPAGKGP